MKKIVIAVLLLTMTISCFAGCKDNDEVSPVSPQELISLAENAQYLPSKELLVDMNDASVAKTVADTSSEFSPYSLLNGGISEEAYDDLIDKISPLDTPYNRSLTVSDVKNLMIEILNEGVIYDEWFNYKNGKLSGQGKFYVSLNDGALAITRCASFQPWVYDSQNERFVHNDDFDFEKINYPIRSDNYLRLSIYTQDGKEVVECEVVDNLSYYDEVSLANYQFMKNVKDTSFTKLQVTVRNALRNPYDPGGWGYDVDSKLPYGFSRKFIQLDYTGPSDVSWFAANQVLPYAFDSASDWFVEMGSRKKDTGFYYFGQATISESDYSLVPSDAYLQADNDNVRTFESSAKLNYDTSMEEWSKSYYDDICSVNCSLPENIKDFENRVSSVGISLNACAHNIPGNTFLSDFSDKFVLDGTKTDLSFELNVNRMLNSIVRAAITNSPLVNDYDNNDVYEINETQINPVTIAAPHDDQNSDITKSPEQTRGFIFCHTQQRFRICLHQRIETLSA